MNGTFKSTRNLNYDILDLTDKPTVPGNCRYPLANLHSDVILHFVPDENFVYISEGLCIREGNLQFADCHKSYENLKKIRLSQSLQINDNLFRL